MLRFSSLGDVVLCSAFVEKLRAAYPQDEITFVTSNKFENIVRTFATVPDVIWGLSGSSLGIGMRTLARVRVEYAAQPFDELYVYDLHGVPKSFFARVALFYFSCLKMIRYFSKVTDKKSLRRWLSVKFRKDLLPKRFIYLEHQKLLTDPHNYSPRLSVVKVAEPSNQILLAPDSQHWKKKWLANHWETFLVAAARELPDYDFTLVGGLGVFPQDLMDTLSDLLGARLKNRLGVLPLSDLSRIASQHRACICSNSAWQHIAESANCPVITLAGPIVPGFGFSPWLTNSTELEVKLNCRPCTRHGDGVCIRTGDSFHACMKEISPDKVLSALKGILR